MSGVGPLHLVDAAATTALGACLAGVLVPGLQVHLLGDLGTGKTTLVRGLLRALGHAGAVRSPTYTLIEPYDCGGLRLAHLDLYRLGDPGELEYLGLRDLLDGETLCLIEWPERGAGSLPPADLCLILGHHGSGRTVRFAGETYRGISVLNELSQRDCLIGFPNL